MGIEELRRKNKLKVGSSSIEPGLIVNNNEMEHAEAVRSKFGVFEYSQPMTEKVLRFDEFSFGRLLSDGKYFKEKMEDIASFRETNKKKFVKAHAQLPVGYHVTPAHVIKWVELQKEAGLGFIEILDVNQASSRFARKTLEKCIGKVDSKQMPVMGINTKNPNERDLLFRLELAGENGIQFATFYGDVTLAEKHVAISEKLKETPIFAHHAGINRVKGYEVPGRKGKIPIGQAHLFQMLGFNAVSVQLVKRKAKKKNRKKGGFGYPDAYDPSIWGRRTGKEMINIYKEDFPAEVFHPATHERSAKEVYAESRKLLISILYSHEASEVYNEMVKTRKAMEEGKAEYAGFLKKHKNAVSLVNSICKGYQSQPRLDQF